MLGRRRMSIDECIDAYLSLSERIFQKKRHRETVKGRIQGQFDAEELARDVREVIEQQGLQEEALLKEVPEATCKQIGYSTLTFCHRTLEERLAALTLPNDEFLASPTEEYNIVDRTVSEDPYVWRARHLIL